MAESANSYYFFRYHPATITAAGVATACVIYAFFATFATHARPATTPALQRSNAVHRPHRDRQQPVVEILSRAQYPPLGALSIVRGDIQFVLHLLQSPIPSPDQLRDVFGPNIAAERLHRESIAAAMDAVLRFCLLAVQNPDMRGSIPSMGLGQLFGAMESLDPDRIREHALNVAESQWPRTDPQPVYQVLDRFLSGEEYRNAEPSVREDDAETQGDLETDVPDSSQGLRQLVYYIAEEEARIRAYQHFGVHCDECSSAIFGIRWRCLNCELPYDLCSLCEQQTIHPRTHVFAKVKIPLSPLVQLPRFEPSWYTGNPIFESSVLSEEHRDELCKKFALEQMQLDVAYERFKSIANTLWEGGSHGIVMVIDRTAFNKVFARAHWPQQRIINGALFFRIYDFYDVNNNGVIQFSDYLSGLEYLRGPNRFKPLNRAIRGFDTDMDGYVSRQDFCVLLCAKLMFNQCLIIDTVHELEEEQGQEHTRNGPHPTDRPTSAWLRSESIPRGEGRDPENKQRDRSGDHVPNDDVTTTLDEAPLVNTRDEFVSARLPGLGGTDKRDTARSIAVWDNRSVWLMVRAAHSHLLDRIFQAREHHDRLAVLSRPERQRWRTHIDEYAKANPDVFRKTTSPSPPHTKLETASKTDPPPTDNDSRDPTMPQNRANSSDPNTPNREVPPPNRLRYFTLLDSWDHGLQTRGGPGRLSYEELEALASQDRSGQILGLIKCWLEHAHI